MDVLKTMTMLNLSQTICKESNFPHFTLLENLILLNKIQMFPEDTQCLPSQSQLKFQLNKFCYSISDFLNMYVRHGIEKIFHECKIFVCAFVHISISMLQKADHSDSPNHIKNQQVYM